MRRYLSLMLSCILLCSFFSGCSEQEREIIDLTALSSTIVYAEVCKIVQEPEKYAGKTIKMDGIFYSSYIEKTQKRYYHIFISDAEACCQQGIEFIATDDMNYPAEGEYAVVSGTIQGYEELGSTYYHVIADEIEAIKADG